MRNAAMLALPMCVLGPAALAQSAAPLPSQVAPQDRRPPIESGTARVAPLPQASPASAAAAADLHVTLAAVDVTGAFDDVPRRDDPFAAIVGRSASLSEIQQAVAVLQAQYDEAGYALVRIVLPPQTLRDGGRMQVRVIDGYIESVEADAVPEAVRAVVQARLAGLVGQRRLRWSRLERQVVLAGGMPGVRLGSALLPGTTEDGVRLAVDGSFEPAFVRVSADNELPSSLGEYQLSGELVLNSPFGLGDQWLLSQSRGMGSAVRARAPLNSTAVGAVMPLGTGGLTVAPQAVRVRTAPADSPGAPTSTGDYRRHSLTFAYPLLAQQRGRLDAELGIERIAQQQHAVDFGIDLSRDAYRSLRLQASGESALWQRHAVRAIVSTGLGLGGRTQGEAAASGTPLSREGASPRFRKAGLDASDDWSLLDGWSLRSRVLAQASFGRPLLRPELLSLDGPAAVSAFRAGELAFDQGMLARIELEHADVADVPGGHWVLRPYVFAVAGHGHLFEASVLEATVGNAHAWGLGWRSDAFDMAGKFPLHLEIEGARGWSNWPRPEVRTSWSALAAWHF